MLYFIPAWYKLNEWSENEQSWIERRMHTEFDDTVKQIQLFHRSGVYPYRIILLGHAPNFRHFLHRQGMYHAPYWSCFDAIQEVRRKKAAVLSFHQLKWPEGIEFVYTPFVVIAMLDGKKYAQIDFGEDGNPIRIDLYKDGRICRRNIYDDRGFISSTTLYEKEQPIYQDYLMENGIWKLRHFMEDGHVEVNPKCSGYLLEYRNRRYKAKFSRLSYGDLGQVIREVFMLYLRLTKKKDIFCVAVHRQHVRLLAEVLHKKKLILSFFSGRSLDWDCTELESMAGKADYVIADSEEYLRKLQKEFGISIKNSMAIPPYDSRVDSGISQQFDVQKILVAVDDIDKEVFRKLIRLLGRYVPENENVRIHLFTRRAEYDRKQKILEDVRRILEEAGMEAGWASEEETGKISENSLEPEETVSAKFFVEQCVDELAVSKCMREQHLFVDLREVPELYLQIMAISIGIPQIVCRQTEFVEHGKNGIILKKLNVLPVALHYYLNGLKNWNRARVYSYELVKEFSTEKLLANWKEVMDSVGRDSYFTVGERRLE